MANSIGLGTGYGNPYLQAARLNQSGPAETYDPNQSLDATQMAQQMFQQQAQIRSQAFNQENPRMALPQNFGASLGGLVQKALGLGQQQQPQGSPPPDPAAVAQATIQQAITSNLQAQLSSGEVPNYAKAKYMAGVQALAGSQGNPTMQAIAAKYIGESKYTPETEQADQDKDTAAHDTAVKSHLDSLKAQQDSVYQVVDMAADKDGLPSYKQYGTAIPLIGDDGKVDPSFASKQAAALAAAKGAGAGNPVSRTVSEITAYQGALQRDRDANALAKADAQEQARQDAVNNVNMDVATANGKRLHDGDMTLQDISGSSAAAVAMRTASTAAADKLGAWSPTDIANRKKAEASWMSGPLYTQFQKAATVPRHLADLEDLAQSLQSGSFTPTNALYQKYARMVGEDPGTNVPSFDLAKKVFAMELGGALNQRGGSNEDRQALEASIEASDTPQTLTKTLHTEEKLWADKFDDMKSGYEQAVSGKKFFGDQVNPKVQQDATRIYSKFYPIETGSGDGSKYYFDQLPDSATVQTPGGKVLSAGQLRALSKANGGQ